MSQSNLAIPTKLAEPRCFVLEPVINVTQAYTQAGEHKSGVFSFDIKRAFTSIGPFLADQMQLSFRLHPV